MSHLITLETKKPVLLADSSKNRAKFSDLTLNTLNVLGNLAAQCKRILPKEGSHPLNLVKCLSFVSAGNNLYLATQDREQSAHIKDTMGQEISEVKFVRSAMQFLSSILYFSSLGLNLSSSITSFKTVITTSEILSKTTTVFSNLAVFPLLWLTSRKLHEQYGFQQELDKMLTKLRVLPLQEQKTTIANFLQEQIKVSEPLQEQLKAKLQERYASKSIENITNSKKPYYKNITTYVAHRFPKEISKKEAAKIAHMKRMTNKSCIELIKKMHLTTVDSTIKKVQDVAYKNIMLNYLGLGLTSIGLLSLGISFIPGAALLSTVLSLIPVVVSSGFGVHDLFQSLQNNKEGVYDRLVLLATGCVGVIASTALYVLAENTLVKCTALLLAAIWLSLLGYVSSHLENQPKSA